MKLLEARIPQYLILGNLAAACACFFAMGLPLIPILVLAAFFGTLIVYLCLNKPVYGFYTTTIVSFFTAYPERILKISLPITTGIEVLILLLFLGSYRKTKTEISSSFLKAPATVAFILYFLFVLVELFNPNMHSIAGWLFYVRRLMMFMMIYIIAYRLFDDLEKIKSFLKVWLLLALITAAYACFQQWFGMLPFEMDYLRSHPHEYKLYFQGGTFKKFSFLSDPTTFGIMAGACSTFMLILAINEKIKSKKRLYFFTFLLLTIGMSYSGTRTTNIMLPGALCLYGLLTITNKKTLLILFLFTLTAGFILFGPIQNATINRVRSTFNTKEESIAVRDVNRKYIQPYIHTHPIGGGIATSGVLGEKYNPNHQLAGFPPDSGLLLAAIELGWIGYMITLLVYFMILYQCVHYYFLTGKQEHKTFTLALTVALFSIIITQYAQVTIGQLPTALFFYAALSLVIRLKNLGKVT